jgi:hypothetical protein
MKPQMILRLVLIASVCLLVACEASRPTPTAGPAPTETLLPLSGVRVSTLTPIPSHTSAPATNTPIPPTTVPATAPVVVPTQGCTLQAAFTADVTIPDGSAVAPGAQLVKTWRVRNSGSCDWRSGLSLVFVEGNQLGGPSALAIDPVDAGRSLDISITLKAPTEPGAYRGKWQLRTSNGAVLTGLTFSIVIETTPTPSGPATATPKPTPIPTFAASIDSFVGMWYVVTDKFGDNVTDTQRLQQMQISRSQGQLQISPATTFGSPYQFGLAGFAAGNYPGGPRMDWEFIDPLLGTVHLQMGINKQCNATVRLRYSGYDGKFIVYQPSCNLEP